MAKLKAFLILAVLIWSAPQAFAAARFEYLEASTPLFEDGRSFRVEVDGIDVVGVDIGPKSGRPALVVGGYTTSFPYLRKFVMHLVEQGFRVFIYNPPGQGRGDLESGISAKANQLGVDGMLSVYSAMRHLIYEMTNKRLVVIGHSLGGVQVRLGSLGVVFDEDGNARFSRSAKARAREETALIVPMFSLGLFGDEAFESHSELKAFVMTDIAPFVIDCVATLGCFLPKPINRVPSYLATEYFKLLQGNVHRGLFGAKDLDHDEVDELGHFILPQNISRQIRLDIARWLSEKKYTTSSGLDLGQAWERTQKGTQPFPVLYIGGEGDNLTALKPFAAEAQSLRSAHLVTVDTGHIGAFLSSTLTPTLAKLISKAQQVAHDFGCEGWLQVQSLKKVLK